MVDDPTEQILEATQKIANGDFNVKLIPNVGEIPAFYLDLFTFFN